MARLRRELGLVEMSALAASMMLGTGIFFGPSITAQEFPSTRIVLLLWSLGGLVALAGAWVFGRLASLLPYVGGPYVYVRQAYGGLPAFLFAWTSFAVIAPTSLAVMAHVFAEQLSGFGDLRPGSLLVLSLWALVAATFVNCIGVKTGGRTQDVLTGLKVLLVAGLVALLFVGTGAAPRAEPTTGGGRISLAFVGILFAVGGWEYAVLASGEVREPRRNIPRALFMGTGVVVVLYLLVVGGYLAVLGPSGVASSTALAPDAAEAVSPGAARFVAVAVAVSAFGTLNAIMLLGPRATFAVASDGLAPRKVAHVSRRWGTPTVAILLQLALACVYLLTRTFTTVAAYTVMGTGIFIAMSAAALPRLRRQAGLPAGLRWEDAAAALIVLVYGGFLVMWLVERTTDALIGLGIVAAGVVPYTVLRALRRVEVPHATPA